jgi:hypothetical protein
MTAETRLEKPATDRCNSICQLQGHLQLQQIVQLFFDFSRKLLILLANRSICN